MSHSVYFGSDEVNNLLNAWASSDTWYTRHGNDVEIFYRLIRSYFATQENPAFENFWPNCIKAVNRQQHLDSTSLEVALEQYQHEALIIFSYENANQYNQNADEEVLPI